MGPFQIGNYYNQMCRIVKIKSKYCCCCYCWCCYCQCCLYYFLYLYYYVVNYLNVFIHHCHSTLKVPLNSPLLNHLNFTNNKFHLLPVTIGSLFLYIIFLNLNSCHFLQFVNLIYLIFSSCAKLLINSYFYSFSCSSTCSYNVSKGSTNK